ncbi:O-antigen ligase family protein [Terasakiella pusilla]|uniref:O-antigen ligase family protein n=1 Tax=Terasakiella pusilla TaxID=64973 RepID=UPI003AA897E7
MKAVSKFIITVMVAVLLTVPWIGFSSLPVFSSFGIWNQSEPLVFAFFSLGFISALTVFVLLFSRPKIMRDGLAHPVVILPFLMGCLSLIHFLLGDNWQSNLLGNAQTGLGGAWFLSIAAISAVARCVFRIANIRRKRMLVSYMILACISVSLVTVTGVLQWKMFHFDDHIAFFAIALWGLPFVIIRNRIVACLMALAVSAVIVIPSHNLSAGVALGAMAFGTFFYCFISSRWPLRMSLRTVSSFSCIGIAVFIAVLVQFFSGLGSFTTLTMQSRHLLSNTVFAPLLNSWQTAFTGVGWGQFPELLMKYVPADKTALFYYQKKNYDVWFWDGIYKQDFHSHNLFVETFSSMGVVGLFLIFAYVFSVVKFARKGLGGAAFGSVLGWVLLNSMWFQMPSTVGVMSVAFGAMSGSLPLKRIKIKNINSLFYICTLVTLIGLFVAQLNVFLLGQKGSKEVLMNINPPAQTVGYCDMLIPDIGRNGTHFTELFKNFSAGLNSRLKENTERVGRQDWRRLSSFLCQADRRLKDDKALLPGVRALMVRSDFIINYSMELRDQPSLFDQMLSGWDTNVHRVLVLAPQRGDLAIPYMNWLYQNKKLETLKKLADEISKERMTVSLGNWFKGLALLEEEGRQEDGVKLMYGALRGNVENFLPVNSKLKERLFQIQGQ